MGRKRLTKACTNCSKECERKQFSRSMWEKDEAERTVNDLGLPTVFERVCRHCQFDLKKTRENAALVSTASASAAGNAAFPTAPNPRAASTQARPKSHSELSSLIADSLLHSPAFGHIILPNISVQTAMAQNQTMLPPPLFVSPPSPLQLSDNEFDDEVSLFDGIDLDNAMGGDDMSKEKRSARAKRRRAKMNTLFSSLATDVGLPAFSDRARVLERTREILRELRDPKKRPKLDYEMPLVAKPIVSMIDVMSEHMMTHKEDVISHSPVA